MGFFDAPASTKYHFTFQYGSIQIKNIAYERGRY